MSEESDWELVARARSGEMDAFAALVRRYQKPLIHFCRRMTGSEQDAEDIAQDSFIRVHRHLARIRPDAKFSTLLFTIARNLTLNSLRDAKRRGQRVTTSLSRQDEAERPLPDNERQPDRAARLQEIEETIERAMALLSPEHREVIMLRELQGLDYDAIARIVRTRKGTVKSRLARAREQLRAHLVALGGELL